MRNDDYDVVYFVLD